MDKHSFVRFLTKWFVSASGLWLAARLLGNSLSFNHHAWVIPIAGLVLVIINVIIKPTVVILTLPAMLVSLGFFMVVINGLMIFIASKLYGPLHVASFWTAILAGMIVGLANYLVTIILDARRDYYQTERA